MGEKIRWPALTRTMRRFFVWLVFAAAAVALLVGGANAQLRPTPMESWAARLDYTWPFENNVKGWSPFNGHISVREDHFGFTARNDRTPEHGGLAMNGLQINSGRWVYDYAHHIVAAEFGKDPYSDFVALAPNPPESLPSRDLSHVRSAHGLHLGMTPSEAVRLFRLPPKTIVTVDGERQFISQQVDFEQREYHIEHRTGFSVAIVFRYSRATSIMLSDYHS
jgi:hypothetical protein